MDKDLSARLDLLQEGMNRQFEKVNDRFESVDQQFEKVNDRFESVDQQFEKVNDRFESVDQQFEKVNGRFESMDRQFEKVNERFGEVDEKLDETNRIANEAHKIAQRTGVLLEKVQTDVQQIAEGVLEMRPILRKLENHDDRIANLEWRVDLHDKLIKGVG